MDQTGGNGLKITLKSAMLKGRNQEKAESASNWVHVCAAPLRFYDSF
jgi:hypothetical protein